MFISEISYPISSIDLKGYREDIQLSSSESFDSNDSDEEENKISEEKE